MADVKEEIKFEESMTIDKRNKDFAYLRRNLLRSKVKGLYPSRDFYRTDPDALLVGDVIEDILGSDEGSYDIKVIVARGADLRFFNLGGDSESNTAITGVDYECGTFGDDGVYICVDDDTVRKINHVNSNSASVGTFTQASPDLAIFDGLYYWWISSGEIYKQLGGAAPVIAFNDLGFFPDFVALLGDQMVIFGQEGDSIICVFWDKSDPDLFDKRVLIRNSRLVSAGNINGRLVMVRTVGTNGNSKEQIGEMIISGWDGEKFVRMNSIKTGQNDTRDENEYLGMDVGAEVMVFGIDENTNAQNPQLFQEYIYKVREDGGIEVQWLPDHATYGDAHIIRIFYNYMLYATRGTETQAPAIFKNEDTGSDYAEFENFTESEYITNFLCSPYNLHKLEGILVAFEKLFEQTTGTPTGEQLDIYYRVSDRDAWTLLGEITAQKVAENVNKRRDQSVEYASDGLGLPEQRYSITKMPDGISALPEFNEIQFRFVSKRGFSVIGAWFSYSYLTRNTLK